MRSSGHALRLATLVTAFATLAFASAAGLSYLWCGPMGEARQHCCCPDEASDDARDVVRSACCETRHIAELPASRVDHASATVDDVPIVPTEASPLAPTEAEAWVAALVPPSRPALRARGRPGARVHARCSVYLL